MNLALVMFTACLFMGITVALGISNTTANATVENLNASNNKLQHGNGFPMKHFVVTTDHNQTTFDLHNKTGVVYQITVEYLFRELAWIDNNEIYLVVNISSPGCAVFLTKCNDYPISLKPNVIHQEYKLSRSCLNAEEGCLNLHLLSTEGPVDGQIMIITKPNYRWFHIQIIVAITISFIIVILLLRQCVNHVLRIVYSYHVMDENQAQQERLA